MGLVSHQIQGKVYFTSWSMDVKVEGQNVDRHLDRMTSNHGSPMPNVLDMPEMAFMDVTGRMTECQCSYSGVRKKCESMGHRTPNDNQQPKVDGQPCWRPNCRTPNLGPMIVDHQPSLVERWSRLGGCNLAPSPDAFCELAASTSYRTLKPRCRGCFKNIYNNIDPRKRVGQRKRPEMSMESEKGTILKKKQEEKFGNAPKTCY
jgi:hypothetical protein